MEQKRKYELSALNVLFCLLVIFIHIISYPVSELEIGTVSYNICMLSWRFASFVVQGFILLSGLKLFLTRKDDKPYGKYLKSRLLSIILPYTVCFIAYYISYMIAYDYPLDALFILKHYFTGGLVCHLYFIPLLLQFDLLLPLWKKIINKIPFIIVIPASLFITLIFENSFTQMLTGLFPKAVFMYNDRIFTTYIAYWIIGCYIGKNYNAFCEMIKNNFKSVTVIFVISLVLNGFVCYIGYNGIGTVAYANAVHDLYVLSAIMFWFGISLKYSEKVFEKLSLLKEIDKASFYIYLYHMMVLLGVNLLLEMWGIKASLPAFIVRTGVVYIFTVTVCIAYVKIKACVLKKLAKKY